jgi:outer membrane biosynthesis protein TonB
MMPPPKPEPAPMDAIAGPAPAPSAPPANVPPTRSAEPRVDVSAEPITGSRLARAVHHIPLLRRLKKDQQATEPPTPLHEVKPPFSQAERRALDSEVPVDVHVYITESGKVDYAELVDTRATSRHRDLADAAVFAARRWSFRPAHLGNDSVPSEAILHFRFKVEEPPQP